MDREQDGQGRQAVEILLQTLNRHLDKLRTQFNLFFAGEIRVPPETEREQLEKQIRQLQTSSQRSARLSLLQDNLVSQFSLYNNMWQKKMADREQGLNRLEKTASGLPGGQENTASAKGALRDVAVDLREPSSFAPLGLICQKLMGAQAPPPAQQEKMIHLLQQKLSSAGIPQARILVRLEDGKIRFKVTPVKNKP